MSKQATIGFSLSGGGTRATAQIGILQALKEHGIKADRIAGTSGGAIVAAMYAAGLSIKQMMEFAKEGSLFKLFRPGLPIRGLTSIDYLAELLEEYIVKTTFEELDIPLSVVATNLVSGRKEHLNSGQLCPAITASCAIPLIFKPVNLGGTPYVDGGVLDNMPVEPLLNKCDIIIGMNVMPKPSVRSSELGNMGAVGMRVFDIIIADNTESNYEKCDIVIAPEKVLDYGVLNFGVARELQEIGYRAAKEQMDAILEVIDGVG